MLLTFQVAKIGKNIVQVKYIYQANKKHGSNG